MVEQHLCSFCGEQIEPGTGKMYARKDGIVMLFCSNKCYKNMVELKRVPRNITWTKAYAAKKGVAKAAKERVEPKVEDKVEAAEEKVERKAEPKEKAGNRKKARAAKRAEAEAATKE